jgi:multicomponent Na+:H+ antiporter subunit B
MNLFSIYLLLRGHNEPGGGFIAGIVGGISFILYAYAFDTKKTLEHLSFQPRSYLSIGLLTSTLSALIAPIFYDKPFFTTIWFGEITLPVLGLLKIGTPLFFDLGVYMLVLGMCIKISLAIMEEDL